MPWTRRGNSKQNDAELHQTKITHTSAKPNRKTMSTSNLVRSNHQKQLEAPLRRNYILPPKLANVNMHKANDAELHQTTNRHTSAKTSRKATSTTKPLRSNHQKQKAVPLRPKYTDIFMFPLPLLGRMSKSWTRWPDDIHI